MKHKTLDIPVDEFASPIQLTAKPDSKVDYLRHLLNEKGVRHIPIVENKKPIGIVTDRDISLISGLKFSHDFLASDIMTESPYTVPKGTPLETVAFEMSTRKIGSALIVNKKGEIDSIFTSVDGLNALIEIIRGEIENIK
ncbi:MAG: histidine kinase [Halobacteriovoraceae bacterium]|nr:histidine kinase [Halobacteriovoraceae bacterium]